MENENSIPDSRMKISRNIKNLYLDPNNYRFVDNSDYIKVSDNKVVDEKIQNRTRSFLEGNKREKLKDLIESFRANGFLKVDVIQARDLGNNNYLVIEGNRRVAALKTLQEDYRRGVDIGKLDPQIFSSVPFEIHDNDDKMNHLIIMGLKHISGNKKWAAINQAQLIHDYLSSYWDNKDEYHTKEIELCSSLAITKQKLRMSQRAYHLILSYKDSDFGDQFTSDMYSIFEEIVKRPVIKDWLQWNEDDYIAYNKANEERIFSWISKIEESSENDSNEEDEEETREPIITKAFEIRDLASFINDENALAVLEERKSVGRALQESGIGDRNSIDRSLTTLKENVRSVRRFTDILEDEDYSKLALLKEDLEDIIPRRVKLDVISSNVINCFQVGHIVHFSEITVGNFKKLKNFKIKNLRRINILAGPNNSGKTTILEAIYLLCNQNDIGGLFQLIKSRSKISGIDPKYLEILLAEQFDIMGSFNNCNVKLEIEKYQDGAIEKYDDYITSVKAIGQIEDTMNSTIIHTYEKNNMKREFINIQHLCNSLFSSPYCFDIDKLIKIYNSTIESKLDGRMTFDLVMEFIRKIDPEINSIMLTEVDGEKKFVVDSQKFQDRNIDLTSYGEGLIRIFELSLCFASCKNGVLLIDEFETAIHYKLLLDFTKFVQELSEYFNVQVFLTTHSKECIDAFVKNKYNNNQISAYLINSLPEIMEARYISGEDLEYTVDSIALDIRGGAIDED
jgi:AAA15 family ATPase/GTPase